jgi:hypothetical protein
MSLLDLIIPVVIVAVAERALARRPQSPAENLAAAQAAVTHLYKEQGHGPAGHVARHHRAA